MRRLLALSTLLVPLAFLLYKPPFRDEPLYLFLSREISKKPLDITLIPSRVPHPPGMLYLLALRPSRIFLFSLFSLLALYFYLIEERSIYSIGSALLALYAPIFFNDALGALTSSIAATEALRKRYLRASLFFFLASMLRFQSSVVAILYICAIGFYRREPRDFLVASFGVLPIARYVSTHEAFSKPLSLLPIAAYKYLIILFFPHTLLLLLPLARDRESLLFLAINYARNVYTRQVYDRYYLVSIAFLASRVSDAPRRYRYLSLVAPIPYIVATKKPELLLLLLVPLIYFFRGDALEQYLASQRTMSFVLAYRLLYQLPHPCSRIYLYELEYPLGDP